MSWRDAPLYVEAHDLARWIIERTSAWPPERDRHLGRLIVAAASDLVCEVSLALTFPRNRSHHLERADRAIVRLRSLLRLARDLALLSPGGLRFAAGRLQAIGRMIGGWRKRLERRRRPREQIRELEGSGDGPPAARGA